LRLIIGVFVAFSVSAAPVPQERGPAKPLDARAINLTVGRGRLAQFSEEASRVSVSDPAIADAVVVSPHEVVMNGKSPGRTTIMVWHGEFVTPYDVTVEPDLSEIQRQLKTTFPNEQIELASSRDAIILTGVVTDEATAKQAEAIAAVHARAVVNLLQSPPADSRQVMLQVKFATIDRAALTQLGVNIFSVNNSLIGATTTQQFPFPRIGQLPFAQGEDGRPELGNLQVSASDLLNLFAFRPDINVGATLRLLQSQNLLEILAEPNLVTVSGREASFLAGGEFPYPVVTSTGGGAQSAPVVTVQFREFGVRLLFTPTVQTNDVIHLRVEPEVSALDFANALTIQGFLIPAISTRRAATEVDLREGESFAIAGLIDNRVTQVVSKIPGIGDLPIIGHVFRSRSTQKSETELLVVITPTFVKPFSADLPPPSLQFPEPFLGGPPEQNSGAAPTFIGPRGPAGGGNP
jgi:pilus assembly protein CpaC